MSGPRKRCSLIVVCSRLCLTLRLVRDCTFSLVLRSIPLSLILRVLCCLAVFSDRFSEGELKNLREGFPPDEEPYTESYEYLSDSDLDEVEGYTEADESTNDNTIADHPARENGSTQARGSLPLTIGSSAERATATAGDSGTTHIQPGKVAIIRDMAATT